MADIPPSPKSSQAVTEGGDVFTREWYRFLAQLREAVRAPLTAPTVSQGEVSSPETGQIVFNESSGKFQGFDGTEWKDLS